MKRASTLLLLAPLACTPDVVVATASEGVSESGTEAATETSGDPSGDGDGDPSGDGDGDPSGDGDGDPSGDGDGDPSGDGDGDPSGDGDGEGEPCYVDCEDTECVTATCEGWSCTRQASGPCDELDGVWDISLSLSIIAHEPRLDAYFPGDSLRVYGEDYYCDEDECGFTTWVVIRGDDDEMLAARFDAQPVNPEVLASFGLSEDTWLAPLTRVLDHPGYCEIEDGFCEDDSWTQRATLDLVHDTEGSARIIDSSLGWAGGGYAVSASSWMDGSLSCVYKPHSYLYLFRDACEGDCPPPTWVESCEPPLENALYDSMRVRVLPDAEELLDGPFDAQCVVLSTTLSQGQNGHLNVGSRLDCVFTVAPDSPW